MGSLADFAENALLNHMTKNAAYTPAATIYLALLTASATDAGTGASMNEVANSGSYARTAISFSAASTRRVTGSGTITFPQATGSWGTVTHWAIVDTNTYGSGNVLAHGAFAASRTIVANNTPSVTGTSIWVEITASNGMTNYAANGFLDRMFRNQAFTIGANYVGLTTTSSSDSASGTEVSGNNYARVAVNPSGGSSPKWAAVSSGSVNNADALTFATPSGSWGTIVGMGIWDAATVGNQLYYGSVTSQAVAAGDTVSFGASALTITQS